MKYFGLYLIEKGLISEETLVKALTQQIQETPSVVKICYEHKLLKPSEILTILSAQQDLQVDFINAAKSLHIWTDKIQDAVDNKLSYERTPIGHILIKMNAIEMTSLTKALDEFLSKRQPEGKVRSVTPGSEKVIVEKSVQTDNSIDLTNQKVASPTETQNSSSIPSSSSGNSSTQPILELDFKFNQIDSIMLDEFKDFFSDAKLDELKNVVDMLNNSGLDDSQKSSFLTEMLNQFHVLKGVAVCVRAPITEKALTLIEEYAHKAMENIQLCTENQISTVSKSIEKIKNIRDVVVLTKSEEQYWNKNAADIVNWFTNLESLKAG